MSERPVEMMDIDETADYIIHTKPLPERSSRKRQKKVPKSKVKNKLDDPAAAMKVLETETRNTIAADTNYTSEPVQQNDESVEMVVDEPTCSTPRRNAPTRSTALRNDVENDVSVPDILIPNPTPLFAYQAPWIYNDLIRQLRSENYYAPIGIQAMLGVVCNGAAPSYRKIDDKTLSFITCRLYHELLSRDDTFSKKASINKQVHFLNILINIVCTVCNFQPDFFQNKIASILTSGCDDEAVLGNKTQEKHIASLCHELAYGYLQFDGNPASDNNKNRLHNIYFKHDAPLHLYMAFKHHLIQKNNGL